MARITVEIVAVAALSTNALITSGRSIVSEMAEGSTKIKTVING